MVLTWNETCWKILMTQAVNQTFGFEWSQFLTHPCELNLLMTAVYSTFMCSNTRLARSQLEVSWLVNLCRGKDLGFEPK